MKIIFMFVRRLLPWSDNLLRLLNFDSVFETLIADLVLVCVISLSLHMGLCSTQFGTT